MSETKRDSLGEYLRKSLCSAIPKPPNAIPEERLPSTYQTVGSAVLETQLMLGNSIRTNENKITYRDHATQPSIISSKARQKTSKHLISAKQTQNPLRSLSGLDLIKFNLRSALNCGDVYAECIKDLDCSSLETCVSQSEYGGVCAPNVEHCLNTGCSSDEICNSSTGNCEVNRKACNLDSDCGINGICRTAPNTDDKYCYKEDGYCEDDIDCKNFYGENERDVVGLLNKCNVAKRECVECIPKSPSTCGNPIFDKDPKYPVCDVVGENCYPKCTTITASGDPDGDGNVEECCDQKHRLPWAQSCCTNLVGKTGTFADPDSLKGNLTRKCAGQNDAKTHYNELEFFKDKWIANGRAEEVCKGSAWAIDAEFQADGIDTFYRCALNNLNSGKNDPNKRSCIDSWGGRAGGNSQCNPSYECQPNGTCS